MKSLLYQLRGSRASVEPVDAVTVTQQVDALDDTQPFSHKLLRSGDEDSNATSDKHPLLGECDSTDQTTETGAPVGAASARQAWDTARVKALGFIVFSSLNFSVASACIKYESRYFGSQEAVFWRSSIGLLLNYAWLSWKGVSLAINPKRRRLLLVRLVIGAISMSVRFYAMANMVLTDATVIMFTSPIATFILGALLLKEKIERVDFVCALLSYIGVLFVARPAFLFPSDQESTKDNHPLAVAAALGGALSQAIIYVCMRKLNDLDPFATTHYLMAVSTLSSAFIMLVTGEPFIFPTDGWAIFALTATAFFSSVGQIFLTLGFQQEKAGIASVMRYFDVIFVLILDVGVLHEAVSVYSIVGGSIILAGAVAIVMRRAQTK